MTDKPIPQLIKGPKPKKPKKKPPTITVEHTITVPDPYTSANTPKATKKKGLKLRLEAQAYYLSDMHNCTIDEVRKAHPQFQEVALETLRDWAREDGWVEKRKQCYANLQKRLSAEASSRLTERLYYEVQSLLAMKDQTAILLKETAPKSWEGVASIAMKIDARLSEIQQLAMQGKLDDEGHEREKTATATPVSLPGKKFDPEFVKAFATSFTAQKRADLREKLALEAGAADAPKQTHSAPVEPEALPGDENLVPEISPPVGKDSGKHPGSGN